MLLEDSDVAHFWDMLSAAREALSYVEDVQERDYLRNRMRQRALERTLEILGEAASRVSDAGRRGAPAIEWRRITGQRVVLAHRYSKIDQPLLFKTTRESVPFLLAVLEEMLEKGGAK
jgi:uncharacterized protein with HEPN domain